MQLKLVTIGVYGFTEQAFFAALRGAHVDTFCDIRSRRGVRGSDYAFANSHRLQDRLAELKIRYLHFRDLAPSQLLRNKQAAADHQTGTARRQRRELSPEFVAGYRQECLKTFKADEFLARVGPEARIVALFCVEREPAACHRSLLAEQLRRDLGLEVLHLGPD